MSTMVPGFGDELPKLLLVNPSPAAEEQLLRVLHRAGVAATAGGRGAAGQKLFGARIVGDARAEWDALRPWVRAIVAFGDDAWAATLAGVGFDPAPFAPGASVSGPGDRQPLTVLAAPDLADEALSDSVLSATLATAQDLAGLSWGCGGKSS